MHSQIVLAVAVAGSFFVSQSEPEWRAPSLVIAMRKADDIAAKANLTPAAFTPKPRRPPNIDDAAWADVMRDWEIITQPLRDCLNTIQQLDLFQIAHHVTVKVERTAPQEDGSFIITGSLDPGRQKRQLLSPQEEQVVTDWEKRRGSMGQTLTDPASMTAGSVVRQAGDGGIGEIQERERVRRSIYDRVTVDVRVPPGMVGALDRDKMFSAEKTMLLIKPTDVSLHPPDLEINRPPLLATLFGELVDVELAYKKMTAPPNR